MAEVEFNLIVIRATQIDRAAHFYTQLGLDFERHRHGKGVEHLTCTVGNVIFEIYPSTGLTDSTVATRIGFRVATLAQIIPALQQAGGTIVTPVHDSPWGKRVVMADPDGHRVELTSGEGENRKAAEAELGT